MSVSSAVDIGTGIDRGEVKRNCSSTELAGGTGHCGDIARKVESREADDVMGLKDNQPTLRRDTEGYFDVALADSALYPDVQHTRTRDKGHGRAEIRDDCLTRDTDWLDGRNAWAKLLGLGMVRTRVTTGEKVTEEIVPTSHLRPMCEPSQ